MEVYCQLLSCNMHPIPPYLHTSYLFYGFFKVFIRQPQAFFPVELWLPAEYVAGLGDVRFALLRVVRGQGVVDDMSFWVVYQGQFLFGKFHHRDFLRVANVHRLVVVAQE